MALHDYRRLVDVADGAAVGVEVTGAGRANLVLLTPDGGTALMLTADELETVHDALAGALELLWAQQPPAPHLADE